jgi:hypothetical protein
MTITVRIDTAPTGESDLVETLRMAVGLALGDARVQVVFTDRGKEWWAAAHARDAAVRRRLDELRDALDGTGAAVIGLAGGGEEGQVAANLADSDLLINSVGRRGV